MLFYQSQISHQSPCHSWPTSAQVWRLEDGQEFRVKQVGLGQSKVEGKQDIQTKVQVCSCADLSTTSRSRVSAEGGCRREKYRKCGCRRSGCKPDVRMRSRCGCRRGVRSGDVEGRVDDVEGIWHE